MDHDSYDKERKRLKKNAAQNAKNATQEGRRKAKERAARYYATTKGRKAMLAAGKRWRDAKQRSREEPLPRDSRHEW